MSKRQIIFIVIIILSIIVGIWHLRLGMKALFVFRQDEPITSWITIFSGPLSTLPAVIFALFRNKLGSGWVVLGGILSLIALFIEENYQLENIVQYCLKITIPMISIGVFIYFGANSKR
jgi:hypothetical protein